MVEMWMRSRTARGAQVHDRRGLLLLGERERRERLEEL
jgi:hypothetical protein